MILHENSLLADDSDEISYLIFPKIGKDVVKISSAAVVIGALGVKAPITKILVCSTDTLWKPKLQTTRTQIRLLLL